MRKTFQKFASLLMALAILFSLAAPAAATDIVGSAVVSIAGETKVDTDAKEVVFAITAAEVDGTLATATFNVVIDGTYVGQPEVECVNGFFAVQDEFKNVDGKWVAEIVVSNVAGLSTEKAVEVVKIYAPSKGEVGNVKAALTGASLSGYVGDSEAFMAETFGKTSVTTEIEEAEDDSLLDKLFPFIIGGASGGSSSVTLPFVDVVEGSWYYNEVASAWVNNLIDGVTATEFMPEKSLTVAEAIKLAAVLYQLDNEGAVTLSNGSPKWYSSYVEYAIANGVIEEAYADYTDAEMNAAVTRAEFVHIFHGAMDNYYVINDVADNNIPDVKLGDYAADEIYTFYRAGICIGNDQYGTFLPNNSIKRSEVATILYRMYDVDAREIVHLP